MQQWSLTIRMSFTFLTKDKMNKKKKKTKFSQKEQNLTMETLQWNNPEAKN